MRIKFILLFIIAPFLLNAQQIKELNSKELYVFLKKSKHKKIPIIDGRDSLMFIAGHINNAINIDAFGEDMPDKLLGYLDKKRLIIYCTNQRRAETLISKLKDLNYKGRIIYMTDGITGWKRNNYKLEK